MKLYHTPSSPPSRSVLMALRCLELDVDVEIVDLVKRENRTVEFLKINPLGQVPVLVDGDVVVTESRAIMAYLANSRSSDKFYPSDARKRAIIDSRLYFDATVFFMNIVAALAPIFFKGEREVTPEVREKLKSTLQHLESFLRGRNYFGGEEPSLADISILSNLVQVKNAFGDIGKMPNISAWYERCSSLPGYYDNLAGGEIIAEFFEKSGMKLAPLE